MDEVKEAEANAVNFDGKGHVTNWLVVGRARTKFVSTSTKVSTEQQVQELTAKVENLESELEAKFNWRMQENMAWMIWRSEPRYDINIEEVCATVSSAQEGNGTPITEGGVTS